MENEQNIDRQDIDFRFRTKTRLKNIESSKVEK